MELKLARLLERSGDKVRAVLNIMVESPYFYCDDHPDLFFFLKRHRQEFGEFFTTFYGWTLLMDSKCARAYKAEWHNTAIALSSRTLFSFTKRDECLAFMMILEFYEHQLEENGMTVEDKENLRFRFGDLLTHVQRRFALCFPDTAPSPLGGAKASPYTEEYVRAKILKPILPELERYRFLKRIAPPDDLTASDDDLIYEALPALYHYNANALSRIIPELQQAEEPPA
jgi:hypothetical protein